MNAARSLQLLILAACVVVLAAKAVDGYCIAQEAQQAALERAQWRIQQEEQRHAKACERSPFEDVCRQVF